jgi:putative ABC transport system permease protein
MGVLQDLRYASRMFLRTPMLSLAVLVSLAMGIGANTAIFGIVNAMLIKPLPYSDPDTLVLVWGDERDVGNHRGQVSATDVADYRQRNSVFDDVTTYANWSATLVGVGEPERIQGMQVGEGYFSIMKGAPLFGRVFTPEEQIDGQDRVIVLGYGLWRRSFGGDPGVVGKSVNLSGRPYTIIGVMPAEFRPLPQGLTFARAEFYRPVAEQYDEEARSSRHLRAIARLKPGITLGQAQAEMNGIAADLERQHPESDSDYGVRLVTLTEDTVGSFRTTLLMLLGAVFFVLLIACANVANLLLARSSARQKEIAIRAALGASSKRLFRQFLLESVFLALIGGALGLLVALWATGAVASLGSKVLPILTEIQIDSRVLAFTLLVSLLSALVFGLAPALQSSRAGLNELLKAGGRGSDSGSAGARLRNAFVVAEIALALVLLISANLLIRSVGRLYEVDPGFDSNKLLTMSLLLPGTKYPKPEQWTPAYNRYVEAVKSLHGVESAGVVSVLPLSGNFDGRGLAVEDYPKPRGQEISVDLYISSPDYLHAMSIPTISGRALDERDRESEPKVALINREMAQTLWPNEDPIGKRIKFPGSASHPQPWRMIVGVVGNVKQRSLESEVPMQIYLPLSQFPTTAMTLVVRTAGEPTSVLAGVRDAIRGIDKDQALFNVLTMDELLKESISLRRFAMAVLVLFGAVALILASVGIYGIVSYSVEQRTQELGIRIALGARVTNVMILIMRRAVGLTAAGVVLGAGVAAAMSRFLASLLFQIGPTDPVTFAVIPLLLIAVALGASLVPARRATRVDPMVALRYE